MISRYQPTLLWGKSGHFQTVVHVKMGRVKPRNPDGQRFHLVMEDGATMSYDVFEPKEEGVKGRNRSSTLAYKRNIHSFNNNGISLGFPLL